MKEDVCLVNESQLQFQKCDTELDYLSQLDMSEVKKYLKMEYTLPDGRKILLNKERILCPEILFDSNLYSNDKHFEQSQKLLKSQWLCQGIQYGISDAIKSIQSSIK